MKWTPGFFPGEGAPRAVWSLWVLLPLWTQTACSHDMAATAPPAAVDFQIQGEYLGNLSPSGAVLAAQVMALSSTQFQVDFLPGGFPGSGWNKPARTRAPGQWAPSSGIVTFTSAAYTATLPEAGTVITGRTGGGETFTLNKVMRTSPTSGAAAPTGAVILFDGSGTAAWNSAALSGGLLLPVSGGATLSGASTKRTFQDFTLHMEFRAPYEPSDRDQNRGNSGIYIQNRYELQILDSFGAFIDTTLPEYEQARQCGSFWEMHKPSANMSFPPMSWQTYDIQFTAARFTGQVKTAPAYATVKWNGVIVQNQKALVNHTLAGDSVTAAPGPLLLQAHGDSVFFRNIWVVEGTPSSAAPKIQSGALPKSGGSALFIGSRGFYASPRMAVLQMGFTPFLLDGRKLPLHAAGF